jgi:3'5'-cyclic nucleotide phosphodiesterase
MSVGKLLSRIVAPEVVAQGQGDYDSQVHDHTYGITSDPLIQFAVVFSALIHDVDHPGVPNAALVKEGSPLAVHYHLKSVAEQNSVDVAWNILMEEKYADLRACIYHSDAEETRFRQLVVNSVMATDIVDKDLGNLRKSRWARAFPPAAMVAQQALSSSSSSSHNDVNRKATIVIEHLIQASDVAHTMQHWQVYLRWNERFFEECYLAFINGRADKDPCEGWYEGEIGFYDFYIIPLAKKLKECGVFGVLSGEYLNYATQNRDEWQRRGKEVVEGFMAKIVKKVQESGEASNAFHSLKSAKDGKQ